jgi:hypothetical protein
MVAGIVCEVGALVGMCLNIVVLAMIKASMPLLS